MAKKSTFHLFDKDIQLATAGIAPDQIAKALARYARTSLADVIANKQASSIYTTFVNGKEGASEDDVVPPGPILYQFSYWQPIIAFALDFLRKRSPVAPGTRTEGDFGIGHYRDAHRVMIGSQFVDPAAEIAADETPVIVNPQPYARKIEVGFMRMSVERGIYLEAAAAIRRQFGGRNGSIKVTQEWVMLPGGYVLKGRFRQGFRKYARTGLKKDTQAGQPMRYPALVLSMT